MVLDILHRLADVEIVIFYPFIRLDLQIPRQHREKLIQASLQQILVCHCVGVILQHGKDDPLQFIPACALINKSFPAESQVPQILADLLTGESDPQIGPWLIRIRLIVGLYLRLDKEPLTGAQAKALFSRRKLSLSFHDIVKDIVWPYRRSEAVERTAFGITAKTQIQIRKFSVF